jgi:hypothetical protein
VDPITLGLISMGVGGAIKVAGDLFDNTGSRQADLMHQQAAAKLSALEETMRRTEGQQTQVLSSTKARMAATGFDAGSGTFTNYLGAMADQFAQQNAYTRKAGLDSIASMNTAADIMGDPLKRILGAAADVAGTLGQMGTLAKFGTGGAAVAGAAPAAAAEAAPAVAGGVKALNEEAGWNYLKGTVNPGYRSGGLLSLWGS